MIKLKWRGREKHIFKVIKKGKNMATIMKVKIKGARPMIIHNGRTANPLDEFTKRIKVYTSKKTKTENDYIKLLEIQWRASLYWDEEIGLYMPTENIMAALLKAMKKHKMGPLISGFIFDEPLGFPIITDHHDDFNKFKDDENNKFKKVISIQRSKNISCRCVLNNWSIEFSCELDTTIIQPSDVQIILNTMKTRIGLGVWTPSSPKPGTYGKFMISNLSFNNTETGEKKEINGEV